ncbi:cyclin-T-like isoform X2 [Ruditapes philippinarum]|nr:cyclin-T-like isoform X2 [Ruditapes philippinarum]
MTTLCLQHRPTVVACVCIYMACRWANYKIPRSNEGREWFQYIDQKVTMPLIEELYNDFLNILNKSPMKLKRKIMGWKGNEGQSRDDERPSQGSSQPDSNRPSTSTHTSNKHSNHDRRDGPEPGKHAHPDQKQSHESKDVRTEHKKEHYPEKRPSDHKPGSSSHHPERKPQSGHHPDPKHSKREERREGHSHSQPHRKDSHHPNTASEHPRDKTLPYERQKDSSQVKKDINLNGRTHSNSSSAPLAKPHQEDLKTENKDSPVNKPEQLPSVDVSSNVPNPQAPAGLLQKSKTAIDFNQYVKRREQERLEKEKQLEKEKTLERHERDKHREREKQARYEREKLVKHRSAESELLNKTFSEGSGREQKHRPPKLDVSLPLPENNVDQKSSNNKDKSERPYNVNIKSPIKPHHNITVKSPIKSSDLKQPKLELAKVQITPEKDGGDPFSVNINTDPAIRKLIEHDKQDPDSLDLQAKEQDSKDGVSELNIKKEIKTEPEDLEPGEIFEPEITLNPEHSSAPDFKIKELNYDPESGMESAAALRLAIKQEPNSSEQSSAFKLKIPNSGVSSGNSPLKIKISTKGLSTDSDHSSGKHSSPHRHKHKHKDKHKSHKHSRDKERHREKHREKHSSSSVAETNGQPLKLSIKLSDTGSTSEHWSVKNKHDKYKHKASISDPSLNKSNNALEPERSQPWSMSDLIVKSGSSKAQSPSRKRRRTPTVDQTVEQNSNSKAAKMGSNRIRRSSSSHSVVSMELSDGEETQANGPQDQNTLNLLNINLMQAIAQTKQKVESLQRSQSTRNSPREPKPLVNRQQSGFDLDGMMWAGSGAGEAPPLPPGHPPPPPPEKMKPPPPLS